MQFMNGLTPPQLSLFDGMQAQHLSKADARTAADNDGDSFSELTLQGSVARCQLLLAPVLRELSGAASSRWLTLVAPPAPMAGDWLRGVELNRDRILLLQPRQGQSPFALACKALRSGRSHTVVSWLTGLDVADRLKLIAAAQQGRAQGLNIKLGA